MKVPSRCQTVSAKNRTSQIRRAHHVLGCPVDNPVKTEKVKQNNGGSIQVSQLLQDIYLIDGVSHITRERIPER